MASPSRSDSLETLYAALMPVLAKAAVGDFSGEFTLDSQNDPRVNELLVGVQVLLDVINEQTAELEQAKSALAKSQDRSVTLLDEVLKQPLD